MSGRIKDDAFPAGAKLDAAMLRMMHDSPGYGEPAIWWVDAGFLEKLRPKPARPAAPR